MSSRGAARRRSRSTSSAERSTGSGGPLAVTCARWLSSSAFDGAAMKRATSWSWCCAATRPCASQTRTNARALRWNHSRSRLSSDRFEELVEEAPPAHAVAQARLVLGTHEQHLLDEELRVVRVVPAAEPEEQVDLVDAREVAGVRAAVLLAPDAVGLVVGAHAVEEAVDVELGEEHVVEPRHVLERSARVVEERLGDAVRDPDRRDPPQARRLRACTRRSRGCCSRGRGSRRGAT